jgi:hypothetical protein
MHMPLPSLPPFDHKPAPYTGPSVEEVLAARKQYLNPGIFLYYKKPIMFVEGQDAVRLGSRRDGVISMRSAGS